MYAPIENIYRERSRRFCHTWPQVPSLSAANLAFRVLQICDTNLNLPSRYPWRGVEPRFFGYRRCDKTVNSIVTKFLGMQKPCQSTPFRDSLIFAGSWPWFPGFSRNPWKGTIPVGRRILAQSRNPLFVVVASRSDSLIFPESLNLTETPEPPPPALSDFRKSRESQSNRAFH